MFHMILKMPLVDEGYKWNKTICPHILPNIYYEEQRRIQNPGKHL